MPAARPATPPKGEDLRDLSAAGAFRALGGEALAGIREKARAFRRAAASPEDLHQLRVALRRWRSLLSAFEPLLPGEDAARLKEEARWAFSELNAARDLDVFTEELPMAAGAGPLRERLQAASRGAYGSALTAVRSRRFARLLLQSEDWLRSGEWTRATDPEIRALQDTPGHDFAADVLKRLRRRLKKRGHGLAHADDAGRHRARLAAKRLRYAAEALADVVEARRPRRRRAFMDSVRDLQDGLGRLNDLAVARDVALSAIGPADPAVAFAAGEALGVRRAEEKALLKASARAFDDFREAGRFWR